MNIDICLDALKLQLLKSNNERIDGFDAVIGYMVLISDDIVDEYKLDREFQKNSDSRFRFWAYVPSVERGAAYSGPFRSLIPV